MNNKLTEQIAYHIFAQLGVMPATFVNRETTRSVIDKQYLLNEKLSLESEGQVVRKNIYGLQARVGDSKEFKMLLADCSETEGWPEFALLVQLKDAPAFGLYLIYIGDDDDIDSEPMIAVSPDKEHWMPCSTYLQATFLAGMEQVRDSGFAWSKCTDYKEQHQQLLSFIKFHHGFYGVSDEGQEG